ncbi:TPA: hypothetical protein ACOGBB_002034 [Staphylococcus aureus]|uniref:hypothetical protein n=1 Tax=Staphylococcus aureus TaxID=1280 RepID=UPI0036E1D03F|nr:hypothetical protein [Staphylococcus aureus]HDH1153453.1 hypothetical protein [Staphylococcus aureus]HDH1155538.1 hypothetical protein [Staphylococcus aureus]
MQFSKTLEAINNAELDENQRLSILEALKEDVNDEEKRNVRDVPTISDLADKVNIRKKQIDKSQALIGLALLSSGVDK